MSTEHVSNPAIGQAASFVPIVPRLPVELHSGDRMKRAEFHRLYEQTPEDFKAELVEGIVYVASPLRLSHGEPHALISALLVAYASRTPGVRVSDNTTILLGDDGEPQPDLMMRILPERGGQTITTADDYVEGVPELVIELAYSSRSLDLHKKKDMYAKYGGREYVVVCLGEQQLRWFDLAAGKELDADEAGILRIGVLPGLWINGPALFANDYSQLMATLEQGLATAEHADFVRKLSAEP